MEIFTTVVEEISLNTVFSKLVISGYTSHMTQVGLLQHTLPSLLHLPLLHSLSPSFPFLIPLLLGTASSRKPSFYARHLQHIPKCTSLSLHLPQPISIFNRLLKREISPPMDFIPSFYHYCDTGEHPIFFQLNY